MESKNPVNQLEFGYTLNGSEFHWLDNEEDIQRAVTKVIEEYKKERILKWSISHRR